MARKSFRICKVARSIAKPAGRVKAAEVCIESLTHDSLRATLAGVARAVRLIALISVVVLAARPPERTLAQDQGVIVITAPTAGATISGTASIVGTASHPQFQRYELAFGYDPNVTNSWFSLQEPATLPVTEDLLGRWNTSGIADGTYILRLRVYTSERSFLEAFVPGVRVQNTQPVLVASATPLMSPTPPATSPGEPTPTPEVIALSPIAPSRAPERPGNTPSGTGLDGMAAGLNAADLRGAFVEGARLALAAFGLIGLYTGLRALWRSRLRR
jgi:hypothetical protein